MENETIQMFCRKFGYENGDGIFAPGGSIANMYGMVLARCRAVPDAKCTGLFGQSPLVAFTSDEVSATLKRTITFIHLPNVYVAGPLQYKKIRKLAWHWYG